MLTKLWIPPGYRRQRHFPKFVSGEHPRDYQLINYLPWRAGKPLYRLRNRPVARAE
jgi:hypothetical protein